MTSTTLVSRRTKIVATVGPACRAPEILRELVLAGVDLFRVNCSHLAPGGILTEVGRIRATLQEMGRSASILLDLQGPKIRTGNATEPIRLESGEILTLVMDPELPASARRMGTTWPALAQDLEPGQEVLFADGELSGVVESILLDRVPSEVHIRMRDGGLLGAHKGINVPGAALSAPSLTEKDLRDLEEGVRADVDYVALSFVRRASDIEGLRLRLAELGAPDMPICAKIEKPQALDDLPAILDQVEAIMVARGDLGVETPLARLPLVQKRLIREANLAGVLVITATQMLDSMQHNPRPTRAEVTDVGNAILDGTDAVMLSGETAAGEYPVESVRTMDLIARETEASDFMALNRPSLGDLPFPGGLEGVIGRAVSYAARELDKPIVVFTWSGASAILLSKSRPPAPIFALTPREATADRLALAWGVVPLRIPLVDRVEDMLQVGERELLARGLLHPGEEVIVMGGNAPLRGSANFMKVERLRL